MQFLRDDEQLDIIGKRKQSQNLWKVGAAIVEYGEKNTGRTDLLRICCNLSMFNSAF